MIFLDSWCFYLFDLKGALRNWCVTGVFLVVGGKLLMKEVLVLLISEVVVRKRLRMLVTGHILRRFIRLM